MKTPKPYALMYPIDIINALIDAANRHDTDRIDQITDMLARAGYVRPRDDTSAPWRAGA